MELRPSRAKERISSRWSQASFSRLRRSTRRALLSLTSAIAVVPFRKISGKKKKPTWTRISGTWALGFRCLEWLDPQQPQARNVDLPTAAAAATTRGLASHSHYSTRLRGAARRVNAVCISGKSDTREQFIGCFRSRRSYARGRGLRDFGARQPSRPEVLRGRASSIEV